MLLVWSLEEPGTKAAALGAAATLLSNTDSRFVLRILFSLLMCCEWFSGPIPDSREGIESPSLGLVVGGEETNAQSLPWHPQVGHD